MTTPATQSATKKATHPIEYFLGWCDQLGIAPQAARHPTLRAAIKAQSNDAVLFFLCGRDYIYNPTDLKLQGLATLFFGPGTPCELNVSAAAAGEIKNLLHAPTINVHTELGGAHSIGAYSYADRGGFRMGGAGNYNLGTKAITEACYGLGSNFLRDMIKAVNLAKVGKLKTPVKDDIIFGSLQRMRNAARRFWIYDMPDIGL